VSIFEDAHLYALKQGYVVQFGVEPVDLRHLPGEALDDQAFGHGEMSALWMDLGFLSLWAYTLISRLGLEDICYGTSHTMLLTQGMPLGDYHASAFDHVHGSLARHLVGQSRLMRRFQHRRHVLLGILGLIHDAAQGAAMGQGAAFRQLIEQFPSTPLTGGR